MSDQPRLFEFRMGERAPEALVVSGANRDAALLLANWRAWPGGAMALVGPASSGKTHLALAWALESGARWVSPESDPSEAVEAFDAAAGAVLVDDAGGPHNDLTLIRLLDLARSRGGAVLMTGRTSPSLWSAGLPDLASRLAALPAATLGEPDKALLAVVLRRLCRERFIELRQDGLDYLVDNLALSFAAAHAAADALDAQLVKGRKPVGRAQARLALAAAQKAEQERA